MIAEEEGDGMEWEHGEHIGRLRPLQEAPADVGESVFMSRERRDGGGEGPWFNK